jgi:CMP-N,N'-diacetyllegionaminic acid synthase
MLKILALVLARGGSKRLPKKNILLLQGKPLICWSIDVVKGMPEIKDILVSTDDKNILSISKEAGALVPWIRPSELATDEANSVDVALHALNWYEESFGRVDGLMLLQPTSPFRSRKTVAKGIELFRKNINYSVIGVSPVKSHPWWSFKVQNGLLHPFIDNDGVKIRSQDLPSAYSVNGSFYLIAPEQLRKSHSFMGSGAIPLIIESQTEAIDIDTEFDFFLAETILLNDEKYAFREKGTS